VEIGGAVATPSPFSWNFTHGNVTSLDKAFTFKRVVYKVSLVLSTVFFLF